METNAEDIKPKNKGGRPATGRDPFVGVRLPRPLIDAIDGLAIHAGTTRSAIIREAVEQSERLREYRSTSNLMDLHEHAEIVMQYKADKYQAEIDRLRKALKQIEAVPVEEIVNDPTIPSVIAFGALCDF